MDQGGGAAGVGLSRQRGNRRSPGHHEEGMEGFQLSDEAGTLGSSVVGGDVGGLWVGALTTGVRDPALLSLSLLL